ncbi:MAG: DUF1565 domain-containing protein, partial [Planctomycetota bacterium]
MDLATGSDSAAGTPPVTALRTIGDARSRVSSGDTVFLLPGVYSVASGESFPIVVDPGITLVSRVGKGVTSLELPHLVLHQATVQLLAGSSLVGVSTSSQGVWNLGVFGDNHGEPIVIQDCDLRGGHGGIYMGRGRTEVERSTMCDVEVCIGIYSSSNRELVLRDCRLEGDGSGVLAQALHSSGDVSVEIERCTIADNLAIGLVHGITFSPGSHMHSTILA